MPEFNFNLPFTEAIEFFLSKQTIPTQRWSDLLAEEHDVAFMVAGIMQADFLSDMRSAVDKAIAEGMGRDEFGQAIDQMIERYGWNPKGGRDWRLSLIYGTNLRTAYSAGRYRQQTQPETLKARPYWQWLHGDSRFPRPLHRALHLKIFPADDPFWQTMYPPCGFGCKCSVVTLSQRDIDRENLTVETAPEIGKHAEFNTPDGTPQWLEVNADPGWDSAPGATPTERKQALYSQALNRLSPTYQELIKDP